MRRWVSRRPQFPRDCLWPPRVGYVSTHESLQGIRLAAVYLIAPESSAWCDAGLGEVDRPQVDQAFGPCLRGPPTPRADPGICLLIGSCVLGWMSRSGECP